MVSKFSWWRERVLPWTGRPPPAPPLFPMPKPRSFPSPSSSSSERTVPPSTTTANGFSNGAPAPAAAAYNGTLSSSAVNGYGGVRPPATSYVDYGR